MKWSGGRLVECAEQFFSTVVLPAPLGGQRKGGKKGKRVNGHRISFLSPASQRRKGDRGGGKGGRRKGKPKELQRALASMLLLIHVSPFVLAEKGRGGKEVEGRSETIALRLEDLPCCGSCLATPVYSS